MNSFLSAINSGADAVNMSQAARECLRILEQIGAVNRRKNRIYLNNGFVVAKLDVARGGTGYARSFDKKAKSDIIIENIDLMGAHHGDIVLAKIINKKNRSGDGGVKTRQKARVAAVLALAHATSILITKKIGSLIMGVNAQNGLTTQLKASQKSLRLLPEGAVLRVNNINGEISEVLGVINDPSVDERVSMGIYDKREEFPEICANEAKSFESIFGSGDGDDPSGFLSSRVDLRHLPFCTIDPVDAKDFDDAIYFDFKNRILYVAIADVSFFAQPFSGIDKEARLRGFSIYFPHKAVPMLPRELSENICSLKPNIDRLAFIFKITLNSDLSVISEELFEGIICSKRRFNYDEVDEILNLANSVATTKNQSHPSGDGDNEVLKWLLPLAKTAQAIRAKRLKSAFDFRSVELKMILDENGEIVATEFGGETASHSLIEECMLLANKAAAKRIKKGIFRNHPHPDLRKIAALLDDLAALGIEAHYESDLYAMTQKIGAKASELGIREEVDKLIIKAQQRARYAVECEGHFGLGFDRYSHFTSPIRRYSDLLLHRLLKAQINGDSKQFNYLLEGAGELCERLNELEREADKVATDFMDRKFARWAAKNIGEIVEAQINASSSAKITKSASGIIGAHIILESFTGQLLDKISVRIISVDLITAKIIGKVIKEPNRLKDLYVK